MSMVGSEKLLWESDSILRVLYYFEQRLANARMLKTIMLGKFLWPGDRCHSGKN